MNLIFYLTYFVLLGAIGFYIFINAKKKPKLEKTAKILAVVLVAMVFVNIFLPDLFAKRGLGERDYILDAYPGETFNVIPSAEFFTYRNVLHAIVRAGFAVGVVSIPFAVFFDKPYITKVVTYIVLPFSIAYSILYFQYIQYAISPEAPSVFGEASRVILQNKIFRTIWFGLINLVQTSLALYITFKKSDELKFKNVKEVFLFLAVAFGLCFTNMPIYTAQHVFGTYTKAILTIAYPGHFLFIAFIVIEGFVLYFIFRNQSKENKYILVLIMSISLIMQYNTFFKTDGVINASRWPLQLCNLAGFFILTSLLTKNEKMFHFTVVVNVFGGFVAIALCDSTFNTGILYCMNIHYMVEHINVVLTPILACCFGLFKPLKKSDIKDVLGGFTIYWFVVLVIGTILCAQYSKTGNEFFEGVNYLFMFNEEKSGNLVSFSKPLFEINISFGNAKLYLVQPAVLIVFLLLSSGVFAIFYNCFKEKKAK